MSWFHALSAGNTGQPPIVGVGARCGRRRSCWCGGRCARRRRRAQGHDCLVRRNRDRRRHRGRPDGVARGSCTHIACATSRDVCVGARRCSGRSRTCTRCGGPDRACAVWRRASPRPGCRYRRRGSERCARFGWRIRRGHACRCGRVRAGLDTAGLRGYILLSRRVPAARRQYRHAHEPRGAGGCGEIASKDAQMSPRLNPRPTLSLGWLGRGLLPVPRCRPLGVLPMINHALWKRTPPLPLPSPR